MEKEDRFPSGLSTNAERRCLYTGTEPDEVDLMRPLRLSPPVVIIANGIFLEEVKTSQGKPAALPDRSYILFLSRLHYKRVSISWPMPSVRLQTAIRISTGGGRSGRRRADRIPHCDRQSRIAGARPPHRRSVRAGKDSGPEKCPLLLPAQSPEGFSVAITEALACSVPVVITDACHFPEVAVAGAGIVCALSAQAVAIGLTTVLDDSERAAHMGQAGLELVRDNYTATDRHPDNQCLSTL